MPVIEDSERQHIYAKSSIKNKKIRNLAIAKNELGTGVASIVNISHTCIVVVYHLAIIIKSAITFMLCHS